MSRPGLTGGLYTPLTAGQVEQIHAASLHVLEKTGMRVENEDALGLFRRGGARIDGCRVYVGEKLIQQALSTVPSRVLLAGRDPEHDIVLEGKRVYAGTGGSPTSVLDPGADTVRPATLHDLAQLTLLADALEHCDFVVIPVTPTDVADEQLPVSRFVTCLQHTTKHIMGGVYSLQGARDVIELGTMVQGSLASLRARPIVSCITSWMVSPLQLDDGVTQILLEWCQHGLPVALSSAPMAGSTSPVTLAGTLVQLNAEQLGGIVLTQLANPGTPVLAGYIPGLADMRSAGYLGGGIEFGIMQAAAAQLAQYYDVPIYCSGGMTDSKIPDAQAGYEKMSTFLLPAMAGANYIHHAFAMVTNMNAASLEQAVIDDEIVGMAMRVLAGIGMTEESLAIEAIDRVGPGGHFLMDPHTVQFMRSEFFQPPLAHRDNRPMWEADGRQDARRRARGRAERLLSDHQPEPLSPEVVEMIKERFPYL